MPQRNRNNMPDGFEAPVPAWAADWAGKANSLTTAMFAVQGEVTDSFREWLSNALYQVPNAPELVDIAQFSDLEGIANTVYIGYWRNAEHKLWWSQQDVSSWWASAERLNDDVGYWREHYDMPIERLETLHSTPNPHGVANLATELEGPIDEHAYAGAARDRIQLSGSADLSTDTSIASTKLVSQISDNGKRVTVIPPTKMCIIRSGQDWGNCNDKERDFYLDEVHPSLIEGMAYLSNNPADSRCLSMRLMRGLDTDGDTLEQTFGLGYALDIIAFEEWAKSHPTHLKIFDSFMGHAGTFGADMQLRLWHEVSVLDANAGEFEYLNCHPRTGLLPYS